MIRPYVEKDPTKFCTVEEFDEGVSALSEFVALRAEAVSNQLEGDDTPVDTGTLDLTAMGTMGGGMGGGMPGNMPGKGGGGFSAMSISPGKDSDTESVFQGQDNDSMSAFQEKDGDTTVPVQQEESETAPADKTVNEKRK